MARKGHSIPVANVEALILTIIINILKLLQTSEHATIRLQFRDDSLGPVLGHVLQQQERLVNLPPGVGLTVQSSSKNAQNLFVLFHVV